MSTNTNETHAIAAEPASLKGFFLAALLWLPLAFFLWFVARSAVVFPIVRLARMVLMGWMPDVFSGVSQDFHVLEADTRLLAEPQPGQEGRIGVLVLESNVLQFCYGIPVLIGLTMATPMNWAQTFKRLALGLAVLIPLASFGVVADLLKSLAFDAGAGGTAAVARHGLGLEAVALIYQFGYLILPAIAPVVVWALQNRRFIEAATHRSFAEPVPVTAVHVHHE
jgi:hypothetical protein